MTVRNNYLPRNVRFDLKADVPDDRDYKFGSVVSQDVSTLPVSVSLFPYASRVEDQGDLSSCTGNALTSAYEAQMNLELPQVSEELSRLFVYYNERVLEGTIHDDEGATIRSGIKTLKTNGVCSEREWPYQNDLWNQRPSEAAYRDAKRRTISTYRRIQTVNEMKICLARSKPFVFGLPIYEDTQPTPSNGWTFMKVGQKLLGYHAMVCMGYDDTTQLFLVKNSWGEEWGHDGWCNVTYSFMRNESMDAWTFDVDYQENLPEPLILPWWQRWYHCLFKSRF